MSDFIGTKLTMNLGERSYDIIVKRGSLENLYQFARLDRRVAVVTDSGVPCLLYTSPSPRDPKTSRMPSSA